MRASASSYSGTWAHFGMVDASTSTWNCTPQARAPDAERLHGTVIVAGQHSGAHRRPLHRGPVPLQAEHDLGEVAEDVVVQTLRSQRDLHDADLGFLHQPDGSAESVRRAIGDPGTRRDRGDPVR